MPSKRATGHTFMDPALLPWVLVSELYWMSYKLLERRFYELGVSDSQARVMLVLHYAEAPVRPTEIATLLFQETQSVTGILNRIEAHGWLARTPDADDRRAVSLTLTPAGRKVTEQIVAINKELFDDLFGAALTRVERTQLEAALRKVRAQGFTLPETDFKLRRAQKHPIWSD